MKMVKSLLLGTAAGLVAVAGAEAADLPAKAKPVEYVKICTVYGEGFFYIPGTDTCIKLGGYVRQNFNFGQASGSFSGRELGGTGRDNPIDQNSWVMQSTFVTSVDVRTQTEYGTLRAFTRAGFRVESENYDYGTYYVERAFIQLGSWTFGRSTSFFDYLAGAFFYHASFPIGGVSAGGRMLGAYTWSFGNGVTWTSSIEDPTTKRNWAWDAGDPTATKLSLGGLPGPGTVGSTVTGYTTCGVSLFANDNSPIVATPTGGTSQIPTQLSGCSIGDYASQKLPDFVSQFNISQAWGSAQVAVATHQISTGYYGNNTVTGDTTFTGVQPKDKYGFALMAGTSINLPMLGQGDKVYVEGVYTQGSPGYTNASELDAAASAFLIMRDNRVAAGAIPDAVFFNAGTPNNPIFSGLQLTTMWSIAAAYEHYWTPAVRTSIYGAFAHVGFNSTAKLAFCDFVSSGTQTVSATTNPTGGIDPLPQFQPNTGVKNAASTGVITPGCNPDFNVWTVGVRTVWNPVKNLDIGLEVFHDQIEQKWDPNLWHVNFGGAGGQPSGQYRPADLGVWAAMLRVQRNFYP